MKKVFVVLLLTSLFGLRCGPSKEEIEDQEFQPVIAKGLKYKPTEIVFLKPDSCKAVVLRYDRNYTNMYPENKLIYVVRDCHGKELEVYDNGFIYGKE